MLFRLPPDIQAVALRKLKMLSAATRINDLLVPPSKPVGETERRSRGAMEHRREHAVADLFSLGGGERI